MRHRLLGHSLLIMLAALLGATLLSFSHIEIGEGAGEPAVLIHEWSQGEQGGREWVELLVVSDAVDLRGWRLTDGGNTDILFSQADLWQTLPAGTLIVIYNGKDRANILPLDEDEIGDDFDLILSHQNGAYFEGNWGGFANTNKEDGPRLIDSNDDVVHDVTVIPGQSRYPGAKEGVAYGGGNLASIGSEEKWLLLAFDENTPALPNGDENRAWVANLRNQPVEPEPTETPSPVDEAARSGVVLIDAVLFDGVVSDDEEAVRIINVSENGIDVGGWRLTDGGNSGLTIPDGTTLASGQGLWLAKDGAAFAAQFGFFPDFETAESTSDTPEADGVWPGFNNHGDEVVLLDATNAFVDAVVYEEGDVSIVGSLEWQGPTIYRYGMHFSGKDGQILYRKRDRATGLPVPDTNSLSDWAQDPTDPIEGRRVNYPGWVLDQFAQTFTFEEESEVTVAIAPDNAFETISGLIDRAETSIWIESHTFQNVALMEHLKAAVERGVTLNLLLDGSPAGGVRNEQRYNCTQLEAIGGHCWFMDSDAETKVPKRYAFLHAKFMIVDDRYAVIGSDNLSPNSWPADEKSNGTWGRRGVVLIIESDRLVDHLDKIREADFAPERFADIRPYAAEVDAPAFGYAPFQSHDFITYTVRYPAAPTFAGNFGYELIQSPENSLNPEEGIFGLLAKAGPGDTVLVQQQYERTRWGDDLLADPNLRLQAYVEAARRGATLWVMLDSLFDDRDNENGNWATCAYLQAVRIAENLKIQCQVNNPAGLGIHNKMILAEIGGRGFIHVGSINGSELSSKGNREVAVQIQSDEAYAYLAEMFHKDWRNITYMPIIMHQYSGPVGYPVIAELLFNPNGLDDKEYIVIANPTGNRIDISGYSISDALDPEEYADLRHFPAGTVLAGRSALVIAQQGGPFLAEYGVAPDFEILETDPGIPNLVDNAGWGDESQFLQWGNQGDVAILRAPNGNMVDGIAYGNRAIEGQSTCELVAQGHSLRRNPYWTDTDSCTADFEDWPAPVPGQLVGR